MAQSLGRKPANLTLDSHLLAEAKALKVNLSRAAEEGIQAAVAKSKTDLWRAENRAALDSSNAHVDRHGLPLAALRRF